MPKSADYRPKVDRAMAMEIAQLCGTGSPIEIAELCEKIAAKLPRRSYWRRDLLKLAIVARYATDLGAVQYFPIFTLKGNSKLPFASFSTLPIITCPGRGDCETYCYSLRAWRYSGAFCRQCQNTILLRFNRRAIIEAWRSLPESITVRLYVDGDFDSESTALFWWNLIHQRPDLDVYGYSKSLEIVERTAGAVPANYTLNLSSGSRYDNDLELLARLLAQPFTRGRFVAVKIGKSPKIPRGFKRYASPEYHRAVRQAAKDIGIDRAFSCPGNCGTCTAKGHACGTRTNNGHLVPLTIAIGVH